MSEKDNKLGFAELFKDCTSQGRKLKTEDYKTSGKYAIIDQGQDTIAGYTDIEDGVFTDVPVIIFGDHTRVIKYVDVPFFLGADGTKLLKAKVDNANYKYLYYALKATRIPNTGYNRHFKWLKEIRISYPSEESQKNIVDRLDKLQSLIDIRNKQLTELDLLVKARFVEMFGDPVQNPMGWEIRRLDTLCTNEDSRRVPITSGNRKHGKYPYYGASGVVDWVDDYIFNEDLLLVSEDGANLVMRSTPIAFSVSGKTWINNHAHALKFKSKASQKFIEVYFSLIDISASITGTAQPKLTQEKLNQMQFAWPPINLQQNFFEFIQEVDKSKSVVQKSLDETQLLFDSLMQKYFG